MTTDTGTPWSHLPLAIIDLEATGLDPQRDRIIEVTIQTVRADRDERRWKSWINPGISMPEAAIAVTDLTDRDLTDTPRFEDVAADILDLLRDRVLISFNGLRFDIPLLHAELARCGRELPDVPVLDPFVWSFGLEPGAPKTLGELNRRYKLDQDFDRPAGDACSAALRLALEYALYRLPRGLDELLAAQAEWDQRLDAWMSERATERTAQA